MRKKHTGQVLARAILFCCLWRRETGRLKGVAHPQGAFSLASLLALIDQGELCLALFLLIALLLLLRQSSVEGEAELASQAVVVFVTDCVAEGFWVFLQLASQLFELVRNLDDTTFAAVDGVDSLGVGVGHVEALSGFFAGPSVMDQLDQHCPLLVRHRRVVALSRPGAAALSW